MAAGAVRVGVDIGGTFTDAVLDAGGALTSVKVLTTHGAPEEGILEGLARVCDAAGVAPGDVAQIVHGTTLATNALIERRGARTALITTEGFRDVIEMRTESRFEQYDLDLELPPPLLPRNMRHVVRERIDADGGVLVPPDRGRWSGWRTGSRPRGSRASPSGSCTPTPTPRTSGWWARCWPSGCRARGSPSPAR